uniref:Uncharacterized LOC103460188 n=1 Tax=Poecilia reticulata TaxID=8081 RepID=A0A3P9P497_POERE
MGLEEGTGVRTDDIKIALKGHVKDGYKFNPVSSLSEDDLGYNSSPSISDRVHVLVCIYDANAPEMKSSVLQKMKEIREAASELGIPQLAILTHVDEACGETEKNLRNVYKSKHLKKKMTDFSSSLGIPMNCIFPVKNYSKEIQLDPDVDALILSALRLMIDFGGNYATNNQHFVPAMGGGSPGLLETPWRDISSTNKHELLQSMNNFQPQNEKVTAVRVLLYGPVGAGKSSFINSVNNILQGRMTNEALASNLTSDQSFTKKYKTYKIKKEGRGNFYPFVFNDIMGLEEQGGVRTDDIKLALKGRVNEGYKFNPASSLSDDDLGYNSSPSISDRVHVLVCVYSANASQMRSSVLQKMREIREAASELDIPQLAILTHIDAACGETQRDLKNIYRSKYLKKKMTDFSSSLGIPMNCILPVKNYSHETQLNPDIDTLILSALRLMIDFGDDYADKL